MLNHRIHKKYQSVRPTRRPGVRSDENSIPQRRNDTALQNIALKASRLPMEARKGHMTLLSLSRRVSMTAHSSGKYRILVLGGNTNENKKVSQAVRFAHVAIPEF